MVSLVKFNLFQWNLICFRIEHIPASLKNAFFSPSGYGFFSPSGYGGFRLPLFNECNMIELAYIYKIIKEMMGMMTLHMEFIT